MMIICLVLTLGYVLLMAAYRLGWARQPSFVLPEGFVPITPVSVIVPARNEADNIRWCLDALLAQQYPEQLLQIIVVDDHSDDGTGDIVRQYKDDRLSCMALRDHIPAGQNVTAFKKAAIAAGISVSKGELIVTTDADCVAPDTWLLHIAALYERDNPVMVVGPVMFTCDGSLLQVFQQIDFMSMQGITAAAHRLGMGNMSNGANLAFSREAYEAAGGYAGVDHLASGDDYLLMMKLNRQRPGRIAYLKSREAIVSTAPQPDWRGFLRQRIRWSSKTGKYDDRRLTAILMLVYLYNCSFVALAVTVLFHSGFLALLGGMLVVKIAVELFFLMPVARFFRQVRVLWFFALLQPLHIMYIVLAGFLGLVGQYEWKGRKVR